MEDGWGVEQGEGEGGWVLGGRGGKVLLLLGEGGVCGCIVKCGGGGGVN